MKHHFLLLPLFALTTATAANWPGAQWDTATPEAHGLDRAKLEQARDYATTTGGSGLIIHRGRAVYSWGDQAQTYDLKSTSKSIGVTLLGVALKDERPLARPDEDEDLLCHG